LKWFTPYRKAFLPQRYSIYRKKESNRRKGKKSNKMIDREQNITRPVSFHPVSSEMM
jgi:hypothetical protein